MNVTREQRHTRARRCPVCGGADGDLRGKDRRCHGFTSADGQWTHCSREDQAGGIEQNDAGLFAHRMRGPCKCGTTHGADILPRLEIEKTYDYRDESGALVFQVVRKTGKRFSQRRPDGVGGWLWELSNTRRVLYKLPDLIADDADRTVFIVEGEKDVDTLTAAGFLATCNPQGAGKWHTVAGLARDTLKGRAVTVIADADKAGRSHARDIEASLRGVARTLNVLECPSPYKDATAFLQAGGDLADLVPMERDELPVEANKSTPPDWRELPANDAEASGGGPAPLPAVTSIGDVLDQWVSEGPLVHEPTGIAALDEMTGGGPVYGSRWYIIGAPDAGKTAWIIQCADDWMRRGIAVGILAVDEEPGDLVTRLAQRATFHRRDCELRDADVLQTMRERLSALPLRMYGGEHTIETAANDLASFAKARGSRAALFVDSIQMVTCDANRGKAEMSVREQVTANVRALRAAATRFRFIAMATSEMARAGYRTDEAAASANDMATAKESGAIEYSARVLVALRSVKGEKDLVEMRVAKNKHGPATTDDPIYLRVDRRHMRLEGTAAPERKDPEEAREERARQHAAAAGMKLLQIIIANAGIGTMDLRSKAANAGLGGKDKVDAAVDWLESEGHIENRPDLKGARTFPHYYPVARGQQ